MAVSVNHYELAFQSWLTQSRLQHVIVDQRKRKVFARNKIKSFDFLLYPSSRPPIITEVKGRKFTGTTFEGLKGMQNWVTMEDVRGLMNWENIFGDNFQAVFVFAYDLENIDVDLDGQDIFYHDGRRYVFYVIELADYTKAMTKRSQKWKTVSLPAADFRKHAVSAKKYLGIKVV